MSETKSEVDVSSVLVLAEVSASEVELPQAIGRERGVTFWMIFVSTLLVDMLSAIDLTAVSTALPTVVEHLHGRDFVWAGGAYTIASTAALPLVGGLVESFGRKPIMLAFIFSFMVGSVLCGAAVNMSMLIAGRTLQGLGSGGSMSVTEIVIADMVPLAERGKYQGIAAAVWALACSVGPPIGGALAGSGAWRWLFFLNLPLCGIATVFICIFLRSRVPTMGMKEKILQIDWIGNAIIITSTVLVLVALTWGGVKHPWDSSKVLVPLVIGSEGIIAFFVIEKTWLKGKTVPEYLFTNLTTLSGYLGTFFHGIVSLAIVYYLPVYLQASLQASALRSGTDMLALSLTIPFFAILSGVSVEFFGKYRPQNYIGWAITVAGFALLTLLRADSGRAAYIGLQVPVGIGLGILWISTQFPVLAPIPPRDAAYALAFWTFVRNFAQSWGVVAGGAVLQDVLQQRLPAEFLARLPKGQEFAYTAIPLIPGLTQPLRDEVRAAFAMGTRRVWLVMLWLSLAGFVSCWIMRELPMTPPPEEPLSEELSEKDAPAVETREVPLRESEETV